MLFNFKNTKNKYHYCIEASNIAGLGSIEVVSNILKSLSNNLDFNKQRIYLRLPKINFWVNFKDNLNPNWEIVFISRSSNKYFRLISRTFSILFAPFTLPKCDNLIILGDFPLRISGNQFLLLHNPHLFERNTQNYFFQFHKFMFKINHKFVDKCLVQTDVMKSKLHEMYPHFKNRTCTILMPVNELYVNQSNKSNNNIDKTTFFYPASFYKHKNHKIITTLLNEVYNIDKNIFFKLTITETEYKTLDPKVLYKQYIKCLGRINQNQVFIEYENCDALFFPSTDETYGLPLVEAMSMGKLILCADLPYARLLCEDEAVYFNPNNVESLYTGIEMIRKKLKDKYIPDWSSALSKLPHSWDEYTTHFLSCTK